MRIIKSIINTILLLITIPLLLFASWAAWERLRDPLAALDRPAGDVSIRSDSSYALDFTTEPRHYRHLRLVTEGVGDIEVSLSRPQLVPPEGLPLVVVLGGLEIGEANFRLIERPGANAIAIYHYPYTPEYWYRGTPLTELPAIRRAVLRVPSQVAAFVEWAAGQPWVDPERITVTGYSFGALFLPAIYHVTAQREPGLRPGVIAYAGADLQDLFKTNLIDVEPPWRNPLAWLAATAVYPIEPALHLPRLTEEFLLINSRNDHQVSNYSWRKLHRLAPQPNTAVVLNAGHMHPDKPWLTRQLVEISRDWLIEREVINP